MSTVHFVLQGKGGVGKSLIASLLYQYLHQQGRSVTGVDTDPVNATFQLSFLLGNGEQRKECQRRKKTRLR